MADSVRLDKWLWAARFFKTRTLAAKAIENGKVEIAGVRPKVSRGVRVGELLMIRRSPYELEVEVLALSEKRGSAKVAAELYQETEASVAKRAEVAESLKAERASSVQFEGRGRPTKKDRRDLMKLMGKRRRPK